MVLTAALCSSRSLAQALPEPLGGGAVVWASPESWCLLPVARGMGPLPCPPGGCSGDVGCSRHPRGQKCGIRLFVRNPFCCPLRMERGAWGQGVLEATAGAWGCQPPLTPTMFPHSGGHWVPLLLEKRVLALLGRALKLGAPFPVFAGMWQPPALLPPGDHPVTPLRSSLSRMTRPDTGCGGATGLGRGVPPPCFPPPASSRLVWLCAWLVTDGAGLPLQGGTRLNANPGTPRHARGLIVTILPVPSWHFGWDFGCGQPGPDHGTCHQWLLGCGHHPPGCCRWQRDTFLRILLGFF